MRWLHSTLRCTQHVGCLRLCVRSTVIYRPTQVLIPSLGLRSPPGTGTAQTLSTHAQTERLRAPTGSSCLSVCLSVCACMVQGHAIPASPPSIICSHTTAAATLSYRSIFYFTDSLHKPCIALLFSTIESVGEKEQA